MDEPAGRITVAHPCRRRSCILGTAGHIDHGKSALVEALTGTHPDRLPEEKSRGMTIELGFARLTIPAGDGAGTVQVGIVDVPGHERFIRTMVAGATGIDLGLLVVAADDGVMPQTREHVEILHLLGVERGAIALTKADIVHEDRIDEVKAQVAELVGSTPLRDWPQITTSAKTGAGLDELRHAIGELIAALPPVRQSAIFRLAVDRVFTIHGRGTVVTGSVLSGNVAPGRTLDLQPPGLRCKVREVQSHGRVVRDVAGGQRAAMNLTGLDRDVIRRGMELATPGYLNGSRYLDARVRILPRREKPLPSHQRVRVSMGTSEHIALLVVVGGDRIEPDGEALVQLRFLRPVVAAFGQRFILRNETAQTTIGGGTIVRPVSRRLRPHPPESLAALKRAEAADPLGRFEEALRRAGFSTPDRNQLACEAGIEPEQVAPYREQLEEKHALVSIGSHQVHRDTLENIKRRALATLKRHHAHHPAEPGLSKDRLIGWIGARTAKNLGRPIFNELQSQGLVSVRGPYVAHNEFRPALSDEDAALLRRLVDEITGAGYDPPPWAKLKTLQALSRPRAKGLDDLAKIEPSLVPFGAQRYIAVDSLDRFKETVSRLGRNGRKFTLAEVRDTLGLSRRVVQPLLEYLDRVQFTKRLGDERVLVE